MRIPSWEASGFCIRLIQFIYPCKLDINTSVLFESKAEFWGTVFIRLLACIAGVNEKGEGERERRRKNGGLEPPVPHCPLPFSLPFPFPVYACFAGYPATSTTSASRDPKRVFKSRWTERICVFLRVSHKLNIVYQNSTRLCKLDRVYKTLLIT